MSTWQILLWTAAIGAPLLAVTTLLATSQVNLRRSVFVVRFVDRWASLTLLPTAVLAALGPAAGRVDVPWLLSGTGLLVDDISRPLLLVTVLLYGAALLAVHASQTARAPTLIGFLIACFMGNAGLLLAADAMTFYFSFSLMSLAAYGAVVHTRGSDAARRAGRIYLIMTLLSELLVLWALVLVVEAGGLRLEDTAAAVAGAQHRDLIIGLLVLGFGIKAGLVPLHLWLPLAHPAAPPPASAVLSGCMIKAGLVGWVRFLPLGEVGLPGWGLLLVALALVGAFAVLPFGLMSNDPKVPLAYSSISQMGLIGVLIGIALSTPDLAAACTLAAVLYAVHHGMAKGGLFLGVTVWQIHGSGRARVLVLAVLAVMAIAVAGAPFTSGALAKYAAKQAVDPVELGGIDLVPLMPWVGTVTTLLLARSGYLLLRTTKRQPAHRPGLALASWLVLAGGGLGLSWYLSQQWAPVIQGPGLSGAAAWDATWPLVVGVTLAAVWWSASATGRLPHRLQAAQLPELPPGDLVVPLEWGAAAVGRAATATRRFATLPDGRAAAAGGSAITRRLRAAGGASIDATERAEASLSRWPASGWALIGATLVLALLAVLG